MAFACLIPLALGFGLAACGARTNMDADRALGAAGGQPGSTTGGSAGRSAGGSTSQGGRGVQPKPDAGAKNGCDGQFVVEVSKTEPVLTRLEADGRARELFRFSAGSADVDWDYRLQGRFVAFRATKYARPPETTLVLLDVDGNVLFRRTSGSFHHFYLAEDGSVSVGGEHALVARADGSSNELAPYHPVLPPQGDYVVVRNDPPFQEFHWLHVPTRTLSALPEPAYSAEVFARFGDRIAYPGAFELVFGSPSQTSVLPLGTGPAFGWEFVGPRYAVLSNHERLFRFDAKEGRLEPLQNVGLRVMAGLGDDGAVLMTHQLPDIRLQLRRTSDLGRSWTDLGRPTRNAFPDSQQQLVAVARGEAVLSLHTVISFGADIPELQIVSASGQTHRIDVGGKHVQDVYPGGADLSADGQCVAAWVEREAEELDELRFIDTATGTSRVARTAPRGRDLASIVRFPIVE